MVTGEEGEERLPSVLSGPGPQVARAERGSGGGAVICRSNLFVRPSIVLMPVEIGGGTPLVLPTGRGHHRRPGPLQGPTTTAWEARDSLACVTRPYGWNIYRRKIGSGGHDGTRRLRHHFDRAKRTNIFSVASALLTLALALRRPQLSWRRRPLRLRTHGRTALAAASSTPDALGSQDAFVVCCCCCCGYRRAAAVKIHCNPAVFTVGSDWLTSRKRNKIFTYAVSAHCSNFFEVPEAMSSNPLTYARPTS